MHKRIFNNEALILRVCIGLNVGVCKSVLRALGCPTHILFWWSEDKKTILVGVGTNQKNAAIHVPKYYYDSTHGFVIKNQQLMNSFQELTSWENGSRNRIIGQYISDLNMVAFKTSEVITEVFVGACFSGNPYRTGG
jgi:hypothetical protein